MLTYPGRTSTTLQKSENSERKLSHNPETANFEALYPERSGNARVDWIDDIHIMVDFSPSFFNKGRRLWIKVVWEKRFISNI